MASWTGVQVEPAKNAEIFESLAVKPVKERFPIPKILEIPQLFSDPQNLHLAKENHRKAGQPYIGQS